MKTHIFRLAAVAFFLVTVASTEASPYSTVKSALHFAIGGVGVAGVISQEEISVRAIRDGLHAQEQLRTLLRESTPAGQMYALFALRQLGPSDYEALAEPFRRSSTAVPTISGCMIHTQPMSEAVQWIDKWATKVRTWEKRPNQAMQPTTGRRTLESPMTPTFSPATMRSLASGG